MSRQRRGKWLAFPFETLSLVMFLINRIAELRRRDVADQSERQGASRRSRAGRPCELSAASALPLTQIAPFQTMRTLCVIGAGLVTVFSQTAEASHDATYSLKSDLNLWTLVTFIGFVWIVKKYGWASIIGDPMQEREQKEAAAVADAEQAHQRAQAAWKSHQGKMASFDENVKEIMAEADRDAAHTKAEIQTLAERETQVINHRVEHEIDRVRDQALHQIFEATADQIANKAVQSLASLTTADHDRLIGEALASLQQQPA